MRALLLIVALAATALPSPTLAAEAPPPSPPPSAVATMDAKVKAERVAKAAKKLAQSDLLVATVRNAIALAKARKDDEVLAANEKDLVERLEVRRKTDIELRWLKGELTPAGTEAAVKAAEEALAKEKPPTDASKAALAKAMAERDEVKRLEAAEKPKDPDM